MKGHVVRMAKAVEFQSVFMSTMWVVSGIHMCKNKFRLERGIGM